MRQILLRPSFIIYTLLITLLYLSITMWLMNIKLLSFTLGSNFSLSAKLSIAASLLGGMFTSMTPFSLFLLVLSGILTGANLTLIYQKINLLRKMGSLELTVGGGLVLGVVGSGCSACGLPILSMFGVTGSLAFLPLQGGELAFVSVILLGISFYLLIKNVNNLSCQIPQSVVEAQTSRCKTKQS